MDSALDCNEVVLALPHRTLINVGEDLRILPLQRFKRPEVHWFQRVEARKYDVVDDRVTSIFERIDGYTRVCISA